MGVEVGGDRSGADATNGEAGRTKGPHCSKPGWVRQLERRVGDTNDGLAGRTSVKLKRERAGRWIDNGGWWMGRPTHWVISRKRADGILGVSNEAKMPGEGGLGVANIVTSEICTHQPGNKCARSKQGAGLHIGMHACVKGRLTSK